MQIIRTAKRLKQVLDQYRHKSQSIGFVPTMGYFHQGHLALMRQSIKDHDVTVVSLYVNPTQFGPKEDLTRYPRDLRRDISLLKKEKVDILFIPSDNDIYPDGYLTYVEVGKLSAVMCGHFRPGHFRGVATIVAKLLNMVQPDQMYLGQKDAQQVVVLKKMVADLNFTVRVTALPTVREPDGLAMSSRNTYLSDSERQQAAFIYQGLQEAKRICCQTRDINKAMNALRQILKQRAKARIQYAVCVQADDLTVLKKLSGKVLIAVAVYIGKTRLIDNIQFVINGPIKK